MRRKSIGIKMGMEHTKHGLCGKGLGGETAIGVQRRMPIPHCIENWQTQCTCNLDIPECPTHVIQLQ